MFKDDTTTTAECGTSWKPLQTFDSSYQPIIEYIILAEFDINTGSTVRHQYPTNIRGYKSDYFAEYMLPEGAHNRDYDFTYMLLNRNMPYVYEELWIKPPSLESRGITSINNPAAKSSNTPPSSPKLENSSNGSFLYGLNLVKTRHDSTVRRGAIVKAMALFSRYPFVESFKKVLDISLERYFSNPSVEVLAGLYESLNRIDLSTLSKPNFLEQCLMRRGIHYKAISSSSTLKNNDYIPQTWISNIPIQIPLDDGMVDMTISIPVYRTPDEVGDISVTQLCRIFGESVMRIYHAVLTKQRILFVGYNHSASDLAQMVLSCAAMVAPPITNVIRRCFPYANLSDLSFLEIPGYIAGVTNPMFQQHESWWDLLCILDLPNGTGHVYAVDDKKDFDFASKGNGAVGGGSSVNNSNKSNNNNAGSKLNTTAYEDQPHYNVDNKFIVSVISGINVRLNEDWVRQQFYDYTHAILNHAQDLITANPIATATAITNTNITGNGFIGNLNESAMEESILKGIQANITRINLIMETKEFKDLPLHPWVWVNNNDDINENNNESNGEKLDGTKLKLYIRKLQYEYSALSQGQVEKYFKYFEKYLKSESVIQGLLILLPESTGGLSPIATGLFHRSPIIRLYTVRILKCVQSYKSTVISFNTLNPYFISAYKRLLGKLEDGSLFKEIDDNTLESSSRNTLMYGDMSDALMDDNGTDDGESSIGNTNNFMSLAQAGTELYNDALLTATNALSLLTVANNDNGYKNENRGYESSFSNTIDALELLP
eukprot:gene9787-13167_t